jgi:hypothetical protein
MMNLHLCFPLHLVGFLILFIKANAKTFNFVGLIEPKKGGGLRSGILLQAPNASLGF